MAPRDPLAVQLDFPQLTADLIDQLRLTGTLGVLNFSDTVVPVYLVGDNGISFEIAEPAIATAQITDGTAANPAATAVIVDTGQLPAGIYDMQLYMAYAASAAPEGYLEWQHRNAANVATLATWRMGTRGPGYDAFTTRFSVLVQLNERYRLVCTAGLTGVGGGTISHRIRPAP